MHSICYGINKQIKFENNEQLFEALGYLCRNSGATSLRYEKNSLQGAYGNEGRIHFYIDDPRIPGCFRFTKGVGKIKSRVNCNSFFNFLKSLGFQDGYQQDEKQIRNNLAKHPQYKAYLANFDHGKAIQDKNQGLKKY
ncbi:TPA: hypothetical protein RZK41_000278 [Campylobacter coli]|nr:hypothetical protein [Campylobacter coli]